MSGLRSLRRSISKAQGTFEGATPRKIRLAQEAKEAAERAKLAADKAVEVTKANAA
jgi:hypothetical protein